MKKAAYFIGLVIVIIFCLSFNGGRSWASESIYQMTGDTTAIDLEYNTVVIEVPMVGKTFTVGGPLSCEAILKKGHQVVDLLAFQVGDRVKVKWEATGQGHAILSLSPSIHKFDDVFIYSELSAACDEPFILELGAERLNRGE
jgi:hypothetical protein